MTRKERELLRLLIDRKARERVKRVGHHNVKRTVVQKEGK